MNITAGEDEELPDGWKQMSIAEVAGKPQYGWTTRATPTGDVRLLRTTDISRGVVDWSTVPACEEAPPSMSKYELHPGDIVVSRAGSVGFNYLIDEFCPSSTVFASYLMRIRPRRALINPRFLSYYMRSTPYWADVAEQAVGIGISNLNASKLGAMQLPVPPTNVQETMCALLDQSFDRTTSIQSHVMGARRAIEHFRRSVLAAACSGRLTADWRYGHPEASVWPLVDQISSGDHSFSLQTLADRQVVDDLDPLPATWVSTPLGALTVNHDGKRIPVRSSDRKTRKGPFPYYGASGVIDHVDSFLFEGDYLLISEDGANLLARATPIAFRASGQFWVNNHAHVVQGKPGIHIAFLELAINAQDIQMFVTGSAQPKLTQAALNVLPIAMPPSEEQEEIVFRVHRLMKIADELTDRIIAAEKSVRRGSQAILAKAMRGDLIVSAATNGDAGMTAQT